MKSYISIVFALLACFAAGAQTNNERNFLKEYETNQTGLVSKSDKLAIVYQPSPEWGRVILAKDFDSSKPIYVEFVSRTNVSSLLYILRPEYGFRFSAISEDGEMIEPTRQGAKYGKKFDDLKTVDREAIAMNNRGTPMRDIAGPHNSWIPVGTPMFTPDELFKFKTPGKYTITIEAACFASQEWPPRPTPPMTNYYLAKFPPVKLTVIKKEEVK
jgi:hypothetical protein